MTGKDLTDGVLEAGIIGGVSSLATASVGGSVNSAFTAAGVDAETAKLLTAPVTTFAVSTGTALAQGKPLDDALTGGVESVFVASASDAVDNYLKTAGIDASTANTLTGASQGALSATLHGGPVLDGMLSGATSAIVSFESSEAIEKLTQDGPESTMSEQAEIDAKLAAVVEDSMVLTAGVGNGANSTIPSWSGDGEVMSDSDPGANVFQNEYEYINRSADASGLASPPIINPEDLTIQRVVIIGNRLPADGGTSGRTGDLSMKYETGLDPSQYRRAAGVVSSGKDDPGGISYGAYQLASKKNTVQDFLLFEGKQWADQFEGMDPTKPGIFGDTWKKIAAQDADDFFNAQHDYIERTKYDPLVSKLLKTTGFDVELQLQPVKDAIWSASVQHGRAFEFLAPAITAVQNSVSPSDPGYSATLINSIYDARIKYVSKLDMKTQASLMARYADERARALEMLRKYQ